MLNKYFIIALLALGVLQTASLAMLAEAAAAAMLIPRPDEHLLCGRAFRYTDAGSSFDVPQMPDITQMLPCSSKTTITKHMLTAAGWSRAGVQEKRRERLIKERIQLVTQSRSSVRTSDPGKSIRGADFKPHAAEAGFLFCFYTNTIIHFSSSRLIL